MNEPDWAAWTPSMRAVLCFIIKDGRVLLIRKKRGLGAGKTNAPGGRIDPGETPLQAACRETREETGLEPTGVREAGRLHFQFTDGLALHCVVFTARDAGGAMVETDEAVPFWAETAAMPYKDMWADDAIWVPWMLESRPFRGYFVFDGDRMLTSRVEPA